MNIHDKYKVLQQNLKAMGSCSCFFKRCGFYFPAESSAGSSWRRECDRSYRKFLFFPGERTEGSERVL